MTPDLKAQEEANRLFETLDLSGIQYPTDQLTILALRKIQPDLFDRGFKEIQPRYFHDTKPTVPAVDAGIGSAMMIERLFALSAYAKARGLPGREGWDDMDQYKPELAEFYRQHGLATGEHQAAELIRDIEMQATKLSCPRAR